MKPEENNMLEPLEHIKKVTPSSALFSKIEQRIQQEEVQYVSYKWLVAASITLVLLIASNGYLLTTRVKNNDGKQNLAEAFHLNNNNQFYHE